MHMFGKSAIPRIFHDTRGASAVEYGLLLAGIGLALFGATEGFSYGNRLMWELVVNNVNSTVGSGTSA